MIIELWPSIERALLDQKLHDLAIDYYIDAMPGLKSEMKKREGLRGSDAGRCSHELWAMVRDVLDVPEDPIGKLTRLDMGSLYGAHLASLFKAGFKASEETQGLRVIVEAEGFYQGVKCHADILVEELGGSGKLNVPVFTADFKTNYKNENPGPPEIDWPHQVWQAAHQAASFGVEDFAIGTLAPAAQWKKGYPPQPFRQDNYKLADWIGKVDEEYGTRLQRAMENKPPSCDADADWRGKFCRVQSCPMRKVRA